MTLPASPPASLRLRIDTEALAANWRALDRMSGSAQAGAAVKADGYGLGVEIVVPALLKAGARHFFVAHWSEVPAVLKHSGEGAVAVLHGVANEQEARFARATGAVPVINSLSQARLWLDTGGGPCHLMVDSGINRLGVEPHLLGDPVLEKLEIDTLMSHLASADEDTPQNAAQLDVFRHAAKRVKARKLSLANSAGIALGADYHFDLSRPGLALYGGVPRGELEGVVAQVAYPEAAVLQVRELRPGDAVGYNATWRADRTMRAATLSIGYADGLLRSWGGGGAVQHDGKNLPIIGRVSMDMIIVDCSETDLREGDFCSIPYRLPQASGVCGLSQYELLTVLGQRFQRVGGQH